LRKAPCGSINAENQRLLRFPTADDDISRYPPFACGLPASRLLAPHADCWQKSAYPWALSEQAYRRIVLPVIER